MKLTIKDGSTNYACSVVEIKNIFDIEGADMVKRTVVNGNNVVVGKDVQVGDIMLYFVSGTKLSSEYCHKNNLYDKAEENYDTSKKGFISFKQKRVKAIKLRGVISDGMLMPLNSIVSFLEQGNINSLKVGDEFTCINGNTLCEKYIIPIQTQSLGNKKLKGKQPVKISRLVDNQFYLHNDTNNLRKNMDKINPNDIIGIHYKKHGTSVVIGNVLVKKKLSFKDRVAKFLGVNVEDRIYDIVYSSRKVIKNQYLNPTHGGGYYGEDIWGVVAKEVGHLIPKNWTLYGEILGNTPSGSQIQQKYDYGCSGGEHKFYVYKISVVNADGQVIFLTDKQIEEYCEKVGLNYKDTFIYYGIAKELYPENKAYIDYEDLSDWRDSFLSRLEKDYNEKSCYMCTNKVPEEGIILRVENMYEYECYKLKSKRFLLMESDLQEKEVTNLEDNQDE